MDFGQFTYPFCYVPHPLVKDAAKSLIDNIEASDELKALFSEGKMLGVLLCDNRSVRPESSAGDRRGRKLNAAPSGLPLPLYATDDKDILVLYAFSGLAGGKADVDGFVPPIYDYTNPDGYFRIREAEISHSPDGAGMSRDLQDWLFGQYRVHNALGEEATIKEVFAMRGLTPPGGTGECAGPKLLEFAYRNGLKPLAMGEFWYGVSPASAVRASGRFYPSCTGKCGPLLSWMMKGLDVAPNPLDEGFSDGAEPSVIYEDDTLIVVDKPAGMLSVPGRVKALSLLDWLRERYGEVHSCHRLDMDTSGIMVFARNASAKTALELQFAGREVSKTYRARLVAPTFISSSVRPESSAWDRQGRRLNADPGGLPLPHCASDECRSKSRDLRKGAKGTIALPLMTDWEDRPRQMVDRENGKLAITKYEVMDVLPNGEVEILFTPLTGRTHQLRVHAAHAEGLGRPIKGDRLYGDASDGRLWLHAESITFRHPATGETVSFSASR